MKNRAKLGKIQTDFFEDPLKIDFHFCFKSGEIQFSITNDNQGNKGIVFTFEIGLSSIYYVKDFLLYLDFKAEAQTYSNYRYVRRF